MSSGGRPELLVEALLVGIDVLVHEGQQLLPQSLHLVRMLEVHRA